MRGCREPLRRVRRAVAFSHACRRGHDEQGRMAEAPDAVRQPVDLLPSGPDVYRFRGLLPTMQFGRLQGTPLPRTHAR